MSDIHSILYGDNSASRRFLRSLSCWLIRLLELPGNWRDRARQRRALLTLDDRLLSDIGVSRAEVDVEGEKPFWRA